MKQIKMFVTLILVITFILMIVSEPENELTTLLPDTVRLADLDDFPKIQGEIKPMMDFSMTDLPSLSNYKAVHEKSKVRLIKESNVDWSADNRKAYANAYYDQYSVNFESNVQTMSLAITVCKNDEELKNCVLRNFTGGQVPVKMKRGDSIGVDIGDYNLIYDTQLRRGSSNTNRLIIFVRNNVYCHFYARNVPVDVLNSAAKEIDQRIVEYGELKE